MKKLNCLVTFGTALLLAGCSNLTSPTATLEASATEAISTQIIVPPSTTNTQQPSPTPTQTMIKTLEPKTTEQVGECRLPCWQGITPGVTTWETAYEIFELVKPPTVEIKVIDPFMSIITSDGGEVGLARDESGVVRSIGISSFYPNGIEYYDLLSEYGEPSEIYLFTRKAYQTQTPGERLVLAIFYYEDKGILANYWFYGRIDESSDAINVCPKVFGLDLQLRPDGTKYSQPEIIHNSIGIGETPIIKIQDASTLSKHDFYLQYKDKNQSGCFKTPLSLWYL